MSKISWLTHGERPEVIETFRKIHASKEFTVEAAHKAFAGAKCNPWQMFTARLRHTVKSMARDFRDMSIGGDIGYDDLLAAQTAAEDAVLAKGAEVWSVADPKAMTVTLHLEPGK